MKNKLVVIAGIIVGIVVFGGLAIYFKPPNVAPESSVNPVSEAELFIRPHSPRFGNSLARVTVVEWLDPECESCRAMYPVVKKLMDEYKDRVHFVIRYMPYHGNSVYAASALAEAWEMGKFEPAIDVLFEKQPEWGDHHQPRPDLLPGYLESVGFSKDKTTQDYLVSKHGDKIKMDEADGRRVGVQGVPSFFINGRALTTLGEKPLRAAIEDALK